MEKLQEILKKENINSAELMELLKGREDKKIDFVLIDVREAYESENDRITKTDYFYPTSEFGSNQNKYQNFKDTRVIIYCRSSSRTYQVKEALKTISINNVSHLDGGINTYFGDKESGSIS